MIEIYSSPFEQEPIERHDVCGITLGQWLEKNGVDYKSKPGVCNAVIDGEIVPEIKWPSTMLHLGTTVKMYVQPKGGVADAVSSIVGAVVGVFSSVLGLLINTSASVNTDSSSRASGSSIYNPNAKGNQPSLGDPIPDVAGRHKVYGDYLTQPTRRFIDRRNLALDVMLCIGKGQYSVSDLKIGATPLESLGSNIDYEVFEPGDDVSGHPAHINWYPAPEVGGTKGSSGLRLNPAQNIRDALNASFYEFSGTEISIPSGAGSVPSGWEKGMRITVDIFEDVEVVDGGSSGGTYFRDEVRGDFAALDPSPGDAITISNTGTIDGDYIVYDYTPDGGGGYDTLHLNNADGSPAAFLEPGIHNGAIDYTGITYRIDSIGETGNPARRSSLDVTRLLPNGDTDSGWSRFPSTRTGGADIRLDVSELIGEWAGPFQLVPDNEVTEYVEYDTFFSRGLADIGSDVSEASVTVEYQWRDRDGDGSWNTIRHTYTDDTLDQIGFTESLTLPYPMVPQMRARRIGQEEKDQTAQRAEWYGVRARLEGVTSYEGVTTIAMRIGGTDTISAQTDNKLSAIVTRKLGYKGGALEPTRSIAPFFEYIAKSAGYTEGDIDYDELDRLNALWNGRGDYYDFVHDEEITVKEALNQALAAGFAELAIEDSKLVPVRDEPRTEWDDQYFPPEVQRANMYSPQNYLEGGLTRAVTAPTANDTDGVRVTYFSNVSWQSETVDCLLPGDDGENIEEITIKGVTDRYRAWRIGMRYRRQLKYQRWSYSFSTELDALNSNYLGFAALNDNIPGYAQSAQILDVADDGQGNTALLLSEPMQTERNKSYVIAYRRGDGSIAGPYNCEMGDDEYEVIAAIPAAERPPVEVGTERTHVLFGEAQKWCFPALIKAVAPSSGITAENPSVDVEAVNYAPEVYEDDNNFPGLV